MSRTSLTTRLLLVAVIAPLVIAGAGIATMVAWLPQLPQLVVVQWGVTGVTFGSPAVYPLILAIGVPVVTLIFGSILAVSGEAAASAPSRNAKLLAVVSLWLASFLTASTLLLLGFQRTGGTFVPSSVPEPGVPLLVAGLLGIAVGVGGWFALPAATRTTQPTTAVTEPLPLGPVERAVWVRRVSPPPALMILMLAVCVALATSIVVAALAATPDTFLLEVVPVIVLLALLTIIGFRVRVDDSGVVARAFTGFPRFRVPLAEIDYAAVVSVNPVGDFGGWGFRWGAGRRFGLVLRGGEALQVVRKNGSAFVVTVDDAAGAASLLNALVGRAAAKTTE